MATREHAVATDVQTLSIRLTNAEIKALPTTPIVILEDPGAGRLIVPLAAIERPEVSVAYTNVSTLAYLSLFVGEVEQLGIGTAPAWARSTLAVDASPGGGALTLRATNDSLGNFTGGTAANGLAVVCWFSIVSV